MSALFAPVRAFSRSLRFRQKFLVIFLLAVLPSLVLLAAGVRGSLQDIGRDEDELAGLASLQTTLALFEPASLHWGLTGRALTGDAGLASGIASTEQQVDAALAALSARKPGDTPAMADLRTAIATRWTRARAWQGRTPGANADEHSAVLADLIEMLHEVGGESGLLLDPDASAYFEIVTVVDQIPKLRELVAQSRGGLAMLGGSDQDVVSGVAQIQGRLERTGTIVRRIDSDLRLLGESAPATLARIAPAWDAVKQSVETLRATLDAAALEGPARIRARKTEQFEQVTVIMGRLQGFQEAQFRTLADEVLGTRLAHERGAVEIQIALGLGLLAVVSWLVTGFARDITQRIGAIEGIVLRLGAGDFTQRLPVEGADEMTSIGRSLNRMSDELGRLLRAVQADAIEVLGAALSISAASGQVAHGADRQAESAMRIAASVEELDVSISRIASSAHQAKDLAGVAGQAADGGSTVIAETIERVRSIAAKVESASLTVASLGTQASTISRIADVIKEIADQTNLLALNAAIEAARAGDMGRGFAVVADEVRSLSERTRNATREIGQMIAGIQSDAEQAVGSMTRGVAEVQSGVGTAERAGTAITSIAQTSVQVIDVASAIALKLREQTTLAREVTGRVESIARTSQEYSGAAASTAAAADLLRAMAKGLETRLSAFRFDDDANGT